MTAALQREQGAEVVIGPLLSHWRLPEQCEPLICSFSACYMLSLLSHEPLIENHRCRTIHVIEIMVHISVIILLNHS